jgi:hypothetical protein
MALAVRATMEIGVFQGQRFFQTLFPLDRAAAMLTDPAGIASILLGSMSLAQAAQSVSLAWNADSDPRSVVGYHYHDGTSSGNYTQTVDVGNSTSATISN